MKTKEWLEKVRKALLEEGFEFSAFQNIKPNQTFGVIKDIDEKRQMHVRGFKDGHLESEIEISRYFLEHTHTSRSAAKELREILDKHGIDYDEKTQLKSPVKKGTDLPSTLTDWREQIHPKIYSWIGVASIAIGILSIFLGVDLWRASIGKVLVPKITVPILLMIIGIFLAIIGYGIKYFSDAIEKAIEGEIEPPKTEQ